MIKTPTILLVSICSLLTCVQNKDLTLYKTQYGSYPERNQIDLVLTAIMEAQDRATNIILVSQKNYISTHSKTYIQVQPDKADSNFMESTKKEVRATSDKAFFMLDGNSISKIQQRNIILFIRKYHYYDPILLFGDTEFLINIAYNLYFLTKDATSKYYELYEICAYCNKGKDQIKKINFWSTEKGFRKDLNFPSSFKGNMYGYSLKFVFLPAGRSQNGQYHPPQREYAILANVGKVMNFGIKVTPTFIPPELINGEAYGLLKMIAYGEADIGGGAQTIAVDRDKFIEYTPFINTLVDAIVTYEPERGLKMFSFVEAFPLNIWIPLLCTVPISALLLHIIYKIMKKFNKSKSKTSYFWEVTKILLWDSTTVGFDDFISTKIYVGIYMMITSLLINIYLGELTSFITSEPYKWDPIDSLNQFENSNFNWLLRKSNPIQGYFENNPAMTKKITFTNATNILDGIRQALERIQRNPSQYGYIMDVSAVQLTLAAMFSDRDRNHNFHFSKEPVRETHNVFYLKKHAIFNKALTLNMMRLTDYGIIAILNRKALRRFSAYSAAIAKAQNRPPGKKKEDGVRLKHMAGSFVFTAIGYSLAFVALLVEKLCFKYRAKLLAIRFKLAMKIKMIRD